MSVSSVCLIYKKDEVPEITLKCKHNMLDFYEREGHVK